MPPFFNFMKATEETTLITGCTSGIGLHLAHCFAKNGHPLVLVAPDPAELQILATELRSTYGITAHPIVQDLRKAKAADEIFKSVRHDKIQIDILVNTAGHGQRGKTWEIPLEKDLSMIRLNIEAVLRLTKLFLPPMIERGHGRILNTASIAEFEPAPMINVYHATQAFILSFSEALAVELEETGVRVTALCPGPTDTDFFPKADMENTKAFQKYAVMAPQDVAAAAYKGLMKGDFIITPGISNKALVAARRVLTERAQAKLNEKMYEEVPLGKRYRKRGYKEARLMDTTPYWHKDTKTLNYPSLQEEIEVDVLVIGGGITGVTTAYLLTLEGFRVALAEARQIGSGDTGHTTAHITYMTDTRLTELVSTRSRRDARLAWEAGAAAMGFIERTVQKEGIECAFKRVPGYLEAAVGADEAETDRLKEEAKLARELGFEANFIEEGPATGRAAICFPHQMQFHPLQYITALAEAAQQRGCLIFEETRITELKNDFNRALAGKHAINYKHAILATHVPIEGNAGILGGAFFQTKLALYSTYAIAARISTSASQEMIWSDTDEPFFYLRTEHFDDQLYAILGGEDHKTGQETHTAERFDRVRNKLAELFPESEVTHSWSGQVVETLDGFPFIGPMGDTQFIATGYSGNGMTFGTVAALMAHDWIQGQMSPWASLFDPKRASLSALGDYLSENIDYPTRMVMDRIRTTEADPHSLENGSGKILEYEGKRIAAHRDHNGMLHLNSAVCPHMGCIVAWNEAEETWDCPCHGSRFRATGEVIGGPAETRLEPHPDSAHR